MNLLGIDYGSKHVGVAYSQGILAEGLKSFSTKEALVRLGQLIQEYKIELVVVGVPEGKMQLPARRAGELLRKQTGVKIMYWDETLSSKLAQDFLIKSGSGQKKRRTKEHQVAAAQILQSFLDSKH